MIDAHNHLSDPRLKPFRDEIVADLQRLGVRAAVVNSASEQDWEEISSLACDYPWVIPAFGIHPWHAAQAADGWQERLRQRLDLHSNSALGEIGLDRWMHSPDIPLQLEAFSFQLSLAAERNRPASIHCLKAWGLLLETLQSQQLPSCGFLLHSYSGPQEMIHSFAKLGAYFSFSPYFLRETKAAQRAAFAAVPMDRLLAETDAPDMGPPEERNLHPIRENNEALNHPANIEVAYAGLAELRGISFESLEETLAENFQNLFGHTAS